MRWFYLRGPFTRDTALTDAPKPGAATRFCAADSAALEAAYQERRAAIDAAWWAEAASLSADAPGGAAATPDPLAAAAGVPAGDWGAHFVDGGGSGSCAGGVVVRSGAWEVDIDGRRMAACYAPLPPSRVRRGTWFLEVGSTWSPLAETVADEIETAWAAAPWRARGGGGARAAVALATPARDARGATVLFVAPDEAYLVRGGGWGGGSVTPPTPGGRAPGPRLRRGYCDPPSLTADPSVSHRDEPVDDAAATAPVAALVLAVHGIGQTLASSSIADDAASLARVVATGVSEDAATATPPASPARTAATASPSRAAAASSRPPRPPRPPTDRVAVVPVQWRKHLALDVDAVARSAAPATLGAIRGALHATAVEVLLYMTPLHAQDMVDSLVASLNAQWSRFAARHPDFDGPVAIVAHSLGSLLCFDVLTAQPAALARLTGRVVGDGGGGGGGSTTITTTHLPPDLTDLGAVVAPGSTPAERALQAEVAALRAQVSALRARGRGGGDTHQQPPAAAAAAGEPGGSPGALTVPPLSFDVATFISVGSPLGMFLALRGVDPRAGRALGSPRAAPLAAAAAGASGDGLPAVARWFNIYHPYDPLAYRVEPLACEKPPRSVAVPRAAASVGVASAVRDAAGDAADALASGAAAAAGALAAGLRGLRRGAAAAAAAAGVRVERVPPAGGAAAAETPADDDTPSDLVHDATDSALPRVAGGAAPGGAATTTHKRGGTADGRLDFELATAPTEAAYLAALSAHFGYWASPDVGLFVARAVRGLDVRRGASAVGAAASAAVGAPPRTGSVRSHALAGV